MSDKEKKYYHTGALEFESISIWNRFQIIADRYNACLGNGGRIEELGEIVKELVIFSSDKGRTTEFAHAMMILWLALEKRNITEVMWAESAQIAYNSVDNEVCRELVLRIIEQSGEDTVNDYNEDFLTLAKETADESVEDILGMVTDELKSKESLQEEQYEELVENFAKLLDRWRKLEVPKTCAEESYALMYDIIELCYKYKAYQSALRLSGILWAADRTRDMEYLPATLYLMGKIMYELGYMEVAKRCFMSADEDTKGMCRKVTDEPYKSVLKQDTKLEINQEILDKKSEIERKVASGELELYTCDEADACCCGDRSACNGLLAKAEENETLGERALEIFEKYSNKSAKVRMKGIDEALQSFTVSPELYEEAAYLYFWKAGIYIDEEDWTTAYEYLKKAYRCQNGKSNGYILLRLAIVLSKLEKYEESTAYLFRAYILCGKGYIVEKVGEDGWEILEQYLTPEDSFKDEFYEALYKATKAAFKKLFRKKEHFYYCTLTITGDGLTPVISAWSKEALERESDGDEEMKEDIEWSYADSPYYAWEYNSFTEVTALLDERPEMSDMSDDEWEEELELRLEVMEEVMGKLDEEGIFSKNQDRDDIVIAAEIMPPDESNTERVSRLNPKEGAMFNRWLEEIAE